MREIGTADRHPGSADLARQALLRTLMQSLIWCSVRRVHQGHKKYLSDRQGNEHFAEVTGMHRTQRH